VTDKYDVCFYNEKKFLTNIPGDFRYILGLVERNERNWNMCFYISDIDTGKAVSIMNIAMYERSLEVDLEAAEKVLNFLKKFYDIFVNQARPHHKEKEKAEQEFINANLGEAGEEYYSYMLKFKKEFLQERMFYYNNELLMNCIIARIEIWDLLDYIGIVFHNENDNLYLRFDIDDEDNGYANSVDILETIIYEFDKWLLNVKKAIEYYHTIPT